jgi:death on curing protein
VSEHEWLEIEQVYLLHLRQLEKHGGAQGVRDPGLLDSALARPQNLLAYGNPDVAALAASYCYGIVQNHPFIDGNKRTGFMAMYTYLGLQGFDLEADEADVVVQVRGLAAGEKSEEDFAQWVREHLVPDN